MRFSHDSRPCGGGRGAEEGEDFRDSRPLATPWTQTILNHAVKRRGWTQGAKRYIKGACLAPLVLWPQKRKKSSQSSVGVRAQEG